MVWTHDISADGSWCSGARRGVRKRFGLARTLESDQCRQYNCQVQSGEAESEALSRAVRCKRKRHPVRARLHHAAQEIPVDVYDIATGAVRFNTPAGVKPLSHEQ